MGGTWEVGRVAHPSQYPGMGGVAMIIRGAAKAS